MSVVPGAALIKPGQDLRRGAHEARPLPGRGGRPARARGDEAELALVTAHLANTWITTESIYARLLPARSTNGVLVQEVSSTSKLYSVDLRHKSEQHSGLSEACSVALLITLLAQVLQGAEECAGRRADHEEGLLRKHTCTAALTILSTREVPADSVLVRGEVERGPAAEREVRHGTHGRSHAWRREHLEYHLIGIASTQPGYKEALVEACSSSTEVRAKTKW